MSKQSSQVAPPQDGVHFVDILPEPPKDAVFVAHRLNGKFIAGSWVHPDHAGTIDKPNPDMLEAAWHWYSKRVDAATSCAVAATPERSAPRLLELL